MVQNISQLSALDWIWILYWMDTTFVVIFSQRWNTTWIIPAGSLLLWRKNHSVDGKKKAKKHVHENRHDVIRNMEVANVRHVD